MKPKIKICGIKDIKNAKVVIDNDADYLGLNFIQCPRDIYFFCIYYQGFC